MARYRSYSLDLRQQVVQQYLSGDVALARRRLPEVVSAQ